MFHQVFTILLLPLLYSVSAQSPSPSEVNITDYISYQGTACIAGSLTTPDFSNPSKLPIQFWPFNVSMGTGIAVTEARKVCLYNIPINYPAGFQYGTQSTKFSGVAHLDQGIGAVFQTAYYFGNGNEAEVRVKSNFSGPWDGSYNLIQTVEDPSVPGVPGQIDGQHMIWSPCGQSNPPTVLHIVNNARLVNVTTGSPTVGTGSGLLESDGSYDLSLEWRTCVGS